MELSCDYTSSGMAALAAVVLAIGQVLRGASIALEPSGYPETAELLQTYGTGLGLRSLTPDQGPTRVRLRDSGSPRYPGPFDPTGLDLLVFDTTCLTASSGRIRAVLRTATRAGTAVALVRSHTKLDSLGIEYGRLGSVVLAAPAGAKPLAERLVPALRTAIRLTGAAAVPEHLPPFVGSKSWRTLTRARVSHIIRNNRRAARALGARCYHHGLFFTLDLGANWTEDQARNAARNTPAASATPASRHVRPAASGSISQSWMRFPYRAAEPGCCASRCRICRIKALMRWSTPSGRHGARFTRQHIAQACSRSASLSGFRSNKSGPSPSLVAIVTASHPARTPSSPPRPQAGRFSRSLRTSVSPSSRGMSRSVTSASNGPASAVSSASCPSALIATRKPYGRDSR